MRGEIKRQLVEELQKRGTAEIVNGEVCQVTQALDEKDDSVTYLLFGELREQRTIPIDEACSKCGFWKGKFGSERLCQQRQARGAKARGFQQLICPAQLVEE